MIYLKWWKERTYNHDYSTQQDSHSDLMEKSKLSWLAEVKRTQHHQPSFTTNAKGTSLDRKHRRSKRPTENKPKPIKMVIESYILIITLIVQFSHSVVSNSLQPHGGFSSVRSLSRVRLFATPWIAAHQASLSITNSSLPKHMSIESVMPSSHLILCCPLLLHQDLFQWVNSLHEVAKVLEFQLQHQSSQWASRTDLL